MVQLLAVVKSGETSGSCHQSGPRRSAKTLFRRCCWSRGRHRSVAGGVAVRAVSLSQLEDHGGQGQLGDDGASPLSNQEWEG